MLVQNIDLIYEVINI